eukprot:3566501-Pyramimonas_sp.AAC.1
MLSTVKVDPCIVCEGAGCCNMISLQRTDNTITTSSATGNLDASSGGISGIGTRGCGQSTLS